MNIVRLSAGLGNQMFQYALYKSLCTLEEPCKIDISEFSYRKHHQGFQLDSIFNIIPNHASQKEADSLVDLNKSLWATIRRKLRISSKTKGKLIAERNFGVNYLPILLENPKKCYYDGFWQSEKYFVDIEADIRMEFQFKNPLEGVNLALSQEMATYESVSIHVRRGDYTKKRRANTWGAVCTTKYYTKAIDMVYQRLGNNVKFYIFSDDITWCKENLELSNAIYVDHNRGRNSYIDMQLMSMCKHQIIANSSFSWWGAWLNNNPDKLIIAPSIWAPHVEYKDIIPANWLRVKID